MTAGPIEMLGTKCPSITLTWNLSAPARSTSATCSPRRAKSAARIDGASFTALMSLSRRRRFAYAVPAFSEMRTKSGYRRTMTATVTSRVVSLTRQSRAACKNKCIRPRSQLATPAYRCLRGRQSLRTAATIVSQPMRPGRAWSHSSSRFLLGLPVAPDEGVRRTVVAELGLGLVREFRNDALRQHLAELDAPLVE